jgi:hypothetical protein
MLWLQVSLFLSDDRLLSVIIRYYHIHLKTFKITQITQIPRICPMKGQYGFIYSAQSHVKRKIFQYDQIISIRFWWKTKCEVKQNTTVVRFLILDSLPLFNAVITHLSVDPAESRWPASGRQLFQGIITVSKRPETLTLAKRRFIEYKTVRNDINIIADPNLHECTPYIIRDKICTYAPGVARDAGVT